MNNLHETQQDVAETVEYEAPRVESVLAPEELEREVAYAGIAVISGAAVA